MTSERAKAHVTSGDPSEFTSLIEPYRRELHLHCYRLLGSLYDAEDLVQETMLRAWQHFGTFKGESSLRTWLYRIATNACFDVLKKRSPRALPPAVSPEADPLQPLAPAWAKSTWLEPYPDSWLTEATEDPAARYSRHESVSLAFLTVLQLLPPRQRAILILSDVLDWRAREIASLLSISVSAVNSALHRARAAMAKQYHTHEREKGEGQEADAPTQALLERYLRAWDTQNIDGLVALMKEDATFTMPPSPSWYRGRVAIGTLLTGQAFAPEAQNRWRFFPTEANGCPAFAVYHATGLDSTFRAFGIQIIDLEDSTSGLLIADVTTFLSPSLFPHFGFSPELAE
ncbi:MAG: sigma-70 family RNA polymerase sigma factor [Ktedonobacteraceae bacterium]